MENQFVIGNSYTIEDIEKEGFKKVKQTSVVMFCRKDNVLLAFDIPKPQAPKIHKLLVITND